LIFDITWIVDAFAEQQADDEEGAEADVSSADDESSAAALKAGRASRAGTKAGRVVRIVRLIRLVRLIKLYKQREKLKGNDVVDASMPIFDAEPSKVGKKLTELTTIRIIILILMMILILPFIDNSSIVTNYEYQAQLSELEAVHRYPQDYNYTGTVTQEFMERRVQEYADHVDFTILNIAITGQKESDVHEWLRQPVSGLSFKTDFRDFDYIGEIYRDVEYVQLFASGCFEADADGIVDIDEPVASEAGGCTSRLTLDVQSVQQGLAWLNMLKTCFIMFLLGTAIIFITRDAETLVIVPIERMMILVKRLADNPLGSTKVDDPLRDQDDEKEANDQGYETAMLEQTLSKIGGLLQVGFGVAGSEIIGANMGAAGGLNVLIPGQKITCVVVFGIIEDFTETCSCLGESICTYINTIADIVHGGAHNWFGAANKNIGSAFLLVWKLCNGQLPGLRDPRDGDDVPIRPAAEIADERKSMKVTTAGCKEATKAVTCTVQNMVDASVVAVLKMCVDLHNANRSTGKLYPFCRDSKMVEAFGDHYRVGMGFGMHIGWAIEGAIGSKYKVDASYLSPNVNMAARLEAATHMYGVHILLSEWFVGELSKACVSHCRRLDKVTVKGSQVPMEMWTFDISSYPEVFCEPIVDAHTGMQVIPEIDDAGSLFLPLKQNMNPKFKPMYDDGVAAYLDGRWGDAKACLEKSNDLKGQGGDTPSQLLMKVMTRYSYKAPDTWKGFRELTSKT
jgi:class 3 adenylate cyclase